MRDEIGSAIDLIGVPEFFVNKCGLIEDAGDGTVRIVRGIERRGALFVPTVSLIMTTLHFLESRALMREAVQRLSPNMLEPARRH